MLQSNVLSTSPLPKNEDMQGIADWLSVRCSETYRPLPTRWGVPQGRDIVPSVSTAWLIGEVSKCLWNEYQRTRELMKRKLTNSQARNLTVGLSCKFSTRRRDSYLRKKTTKNQSVIGEILSKIKCNNCFLFSSSLQSATFCKNCMECEQGMYYIT